MDLVCVEYVLDVGTIGREEGTARTKDIVNLGGRTGYAEEREGSEDKGAVEDGVGVSTCGIGPIWKEHWWNEYRENWITSH